MKAPGNRERPSVGGPEPQIRPPDINVCEPSIERRDVDRRNPPDAQMPGPAARYVISPSRANTSI
jgi:hypothetical protein